ncbi:hypothetical protein [Streptomyces sp. NPDC051776]|uniref:hypothetical protein n=1 Tax=Streptomyces sp. NPDC051776 TaxID=3155414 RepID=UPI003413D02B
MFHSRREPVPFAFVSEAERFRSNVTPPPRQRPGTSRIAGRALIGLTAVAGLVGALVFGTPALQPAQPGASGNTQPEASDGR